MGWIRKVKKKIRKRFFPTPKDLAERLFYSVELGEGDIVLDCGANVGEFTEYLAASGAEVLAFEPHPDAFAILKLRMMRFPNVKCYNKAVWIEDSKIRLFRSSQGKGIRDSESSSILSEKENVNSANYFEVECVNLISLLQSFPAPVRLMKMDIEGAEVEILESIVEHGCEGLIEYAFIETHDRSIPSLADRTERVRLKLEQLDPKSGSFYNFDWH
jgi:FkbM family methyltransferase